MANIRRGTIVEGVDLWCNQGTSDKVYNITLEDVGGGQFVVNAHNGRRGSTLTPQVKTPSPVAYAQAKRVFDRVESEKVAKGYHVTGRTGNQASAAQASPAPTSPSPQSAIAPTAPVASVVSYQPVGYIPQLPNYVERVEFEELVFDDNYYFQQKMDGVHLLLGYFNSQVLASNKKGKGIQPPDSIAAELLELVQATGNDAGICNDGEYLRDNLYVFDLHMLGGQSLALLPFSKRSERMDRLAEAYATWRREQGFDGEPRIHFLPTARTTQEKQALFEQIERSGGEGLVAKFAHGLIRPGRPASGGEQLKFQFRKRADVIVRPTDKRSLECFVYLDGDLVSVGGCASGVTQGDYDRAVEAEREGRTLVAEVRYLYATGEVQKAVGNVKGGQLYQSAFQRYRDDKEPHECLASQLVTTNKSVVSLTQIASAIVSDAA